MPRFAANLTTMYNEHAFLDRFGAAARDGFKAVECLLPYEFPPAEIKAQLVDNGLKQVLFNAPPGDRTGGERGLASLPGREAEFRRSIEIALDYAAALGNDRLPVMAWLIETQHAREQREQYCDVYIKNLKLAASMAQTARVTIVIEPINTRDMPGYFLNRQDEAQAICEEIGLPNRSRRIVMQGAHHDHAGKARCRSDARCPGQRFALTAAKQAQEPPMDSLARR